MKKTQTVERTVPPGLTLYQFLDGRNINEVKSEFTRTIERKDIPGRPCFEGYRADTLMTICQQLCEAQSWGEGHQVLVKDRLTTLWKNHTAPKGEPRARIIFEDKTSNPPFRVVLYLLKQQIAHSQLMEVPLYGIYDNGACISYYTLDPTETDNEHPISTLFLGFNNPDAAPERSPLITVQSFDEPDHEPYWCVTSTSVDGFCANEDVKYYAVFIPKQVVLTDINPDGLTLLHTYPWCPIPVSPYQLPVFPPEWVWENRNGEYVARILPRCVGRRLVILNAAMSNSAANLDE